MQARHRDPKSKGRRGFAVSATLHLLSYKEKCMHLFELEKQGSLIQFSPWSPLLGAAPLSTQHVFGKSLIKTQLLPNISYCTGIIREQRSAELRRGKPTHSQQESDINQHHPYPGCDHREQIPGHQEVTSDILFYFCAPSNQLTKRTGTSCPEPGLLLVQADIS